MTDDNTPENARARSPSKPTYSISTRFTDRGETFVVEVTATEELNSDEDSTPSDDAESDKSRSSSKIPDEGHTRRYEVSVMLMLQVATLVIAFCVLI